MPLKPLINFRLLEADRTNFKLACEKLGLTMTEVLREAIRQTIEKSKNVETREISYATGPNIRP
jgi:antitoxin component of RelBE/YafQ-DinJ toxin-antitoxin module